MACLQVLMLGLALVAAPWLQSHSVRAIEYADYGDHGDDVPAFSESDVLVLTDANFSSAVDSTPLMLVEFYAPWCGHCKSLAPEYAAAATAIRKIDLPVVLAKVDATQAIELSSKYGIEGYPTLKWFASGVPSDYGGGRDRDSIVRWIKKKAGPFAVTLETPAEHKSFEHTNSVYVLGHFTKLNKDNAAYAAFVAAADDLDAEVAVTTSDEVAKAAGAAPGAIVLVKNFVNEERIVVPYTAAMAASELHQFVMVHSMPLTLSFTEANMDMIFGSEILHHLLLIAPPLELIPTAPTFQAFLGAAKRMYDERKFVFVTVDAASEESEPVLEFFNHDDENEVAVVAFQIEPEQLKWWFNDTLTTNNLVTFASAVADGSLAPHRMSEPVPENDMDGDVKIVVADSFDDIVLDAAKDVLLEIYAPWCGHCQALEPIYKELAAKFKDVESVVIAKMDGTKNEHKEVFVEGFPAIFFFPAEQHKAGIEFEGGRTLNELLAFVKKEAESQFTLDESASPAEAKDEL